MLNKILKSGFLVVFLFSLAMMVSCFSSSHGNNQPEINYFTIEINEYVQNPETGDFDKKLLNTKKLSEGSTFTFTPTEKENYTIDSKKSCFKIGFANANSEIKIYYVCETCVATFSGGEGAVLISGETVQTLRKGQTPKIPIYKRDGYKFLGFENADKPVYEDTAFVANWTTAEYLLTLVVPGDVEITDIAYKKDENDAFIYTREFDKNSRFTLPELTYKDNVFVGWFTTPDLNGTKYTEISGDILKDIKLYAVFSNPFYQIEFVCPEGIYCAPIYLERGGEINPPTIKAENQKPGYGLNWYEDENYQHMFTFTVMPEGGKTLYGKWEKDTGTGFFNWDINSETIDSFDELVIYTDYVAYNYMTDGPFIEVTYGDYEMIKNDFQKLAEVMEYNITSPFTMSSSNGAKLEIQITLNENMKGKEATRSTDPSGNTPYKYVDYDEKGRKEKPLYIEGLSEGYKCETTNQLMYVVEHGYKPILKAGSPAEKAYNQAKALLNDILEDGYSDYEKARKIFDYLAYKIDYDQKVVDLLNVNNVSWTLYDAFYLEGVFNNQRAVCDGISKAYSLMCNMEGIPCVQVAGNGHAWCKTKLKNRWTIVDPTHGNTGISGTNKTIMSHEHFCMKESEKEKLGFTTYEFKKIRADSSLNYSAFRTYEFNGSTYNYVFRNADDLARYIRYLSENGKDFNGGVIDFTCHIESPLGELFAKEHISKMITNALSKCSDLPVYSVGYSTYYMNDYFGDKLVKVVFN